MSSMQAMIQPMVLFLGLIIQLMFGVRLAEDQLEVMTNGIIATILAVTAVVAYFEGKKKDKT